MTHRRILEFSTSFYKIKHPRTHLDRRHPTTGRKTCRQRIPMRCFLSNLLLFSYGFLFLIQGGESFVGRNEPRKSGERLACTKIGAHSKTSSSSNFLLKPDFQSSGTCPNPSRRQLLASVAIISTSMSSFDPEANALSLFQTQERRQLEFCLVNVMRVVAWAETLSQELQEAADNIDARRGRYLEARLGAKACLTNRVGGGSTIRVYTLASLQLVGCLQDLEYYSRPRSARVDDLRRDFTEALGSVVEFDGLESVTDPSPRSGLTLQQYNNDKAVFVQRMLQERVVTIGNDLIACFPKDAVATSEGYMREYYATELPPSARKHNINDNVAENQILS